jgi:hypothetical protein
MGSVAAHVYSTKLFEIIDTNSSYIVSECEICVAVFCTEKQAFRLHKISQCLPTVIKIAKLGEGSPCQMEW